MRTPPLAFVGHESLVRALRDIFRSTSFGHALTLVGQDTPAAAEVAHWVSRLALCEASQDEPCEQCVACRSTQHPHAEDLLSISPGENGYAVEAIRVLRRQLQLRGLRRIVIIHHADQLRGAAANALLKTLEEPLGDVRFILLTADRQSLLATLRSRTMVFYVQRVAAEVALEALIARGYPRAAAVRALRACPGMPVAAAALLDDSVTYTLHQRYEDTAQRWHQVPLAERLRSAADVFEDRADTSVQRRQLKTCIAAAARTWPPQLRTHLALCTASLDLQTNAQPKFILDALLTRV